jgi:hypothetical protein
LALSGRGFGYAVHEDDGTLANWGIKSVKRGKSAKSLLCVEELIAFFHPGVIVLHATEDRRWPRLKSLADETAAVAARHNILVIQFSRKHIRETFFEAGKGTKHLIASVLAKRFPQLAFCLPPRRRPWEGEDYWMDVFDAVALAVVYLIPLSSR